MNNNFTRGGGGPYPRLPSPRFRRRCNANTYRDCFVGVHQTSGQVPGALNTRVRFLDEQDLVTLHQYRARHVADIASVTLSKTYTVTVIWRLSNVYLNYSLVHSDLLAFFALGSPRAGIDVGVAIITFFNSSISL